MSEIKKVAVVGATGNLGGPILQALVAGAFDVTVLSRSSSASLPISGVKVVQTDYEASSLEQALQGQDAVVSVIAGAALLEQKKVIDAAVAAGVKRFVPSEFGSDTNNKSAQELVPVFQKKVEVKEYLESKTGSGLTWTGIVTGPVFDRSLKLGLLGFDLSNKKATIYDSGDRPFTTSTATQVGLAVVGVLTNPAATANKYVYVGSFTTTQKEVLATLKSVTGDEWTTENTTSSGAVETAREKVSRRDSTAIRPLVTAAMYHERGGGDYESEVGLSNDILGLAKENLETIVKAVV